MPELVELDRTMGTYRRAAPLMARGSGAWMEDESGTKYLDWISGIGANSLGHGHPGLAAALHDQALTLGHVSNLYRHGPGEELSRRLVERTGMDSVFFSNSGSEANEAALKLARKLQGMRGFPGRQSFVALTGGFHGRTFGSLSVTAKEAYRAPFGSMLDVAFVDPGDTAALTKALHQGPAALILEPIQGEGGLRALCAGFLRAASELCEATGTVLIHDEVQCGGGRTGTFLAASAHGITPDVVTLAKPIGAGLPIGATLARGDAAGALVPGDHGSTFGGGPFAARAGLAVLDELDGGLQDHVVEIGAAFEKALDAIADKHDACLCRRGKGLMQGLVVPGQSAVVVDRLMDLGVLACTAAGDVVRFLPPYVLTHDDLAIGLERLDTALSSLSASAS